MNNIDLYHRLFLGSLISSAALAASAVIIFFVMKIREAAAYLSGRTKRICIEQMEKEIGRPAWGKGCIAAFNTERQIIWVHTDEVINQGGLK